MSANQLIHTKYVVREKTTGERVDEGAYFVLQLDTDIHARRAVAASADSIAAENPTFALELHAWIRDCGGVS